jgi:RNA polymerase sigma-70 factor (ECF subfamily)
MQRQLLLVTLLLLTAAAAAPATKPAAPAGKLIEIAIDDGASAGRKSIAGSGHAVVLDSPTGGGSLVAVKIFGSRYGTPQPPAEDFSLYLCDADGKQLKEFKFPYKLFLRGDPRWVTLKLPDPVELPAAADKFILCVGFNPQQTKGVYVHFDKHADGDNRIGLPGSLNDAFGQGDWMIRAQVAAHEAAKP